MLRLTLDNGQMFERVFYAYISTENQYEKFLRELLKEMEQRKEILCEIWVEVSVSPIKIKRRSPTKEEELAACIERGGLYSQ